MIHLLSLSLPLSFLHTVVPLLSSHHTCPVNQYPFSCSACLSFSLLNSTYATASQQCEEQDGGLLTIRDEVEWKMLMLYLDSLNLSHAGVWLGYTYVSPLLPLHLHHPSSQGWASQYPLIDCYFYVLHVLFVIACDWQALDFMYSFLRIHDKEQIFWSEPALRLRVALCALHVYDCI